MINFLISLDIKVIVMLTSFVAPTVFIGLHYFAERATDKRRNRDRIESIALCFEDRVEKLLVAASKLTYKNLDTDSEEIIEEFKIDTFAKFRALKRYYDKHNKDLMIDNDQFILLGRIVKEFVYNTSTKEKWKELYSSGGGSNTLLNVCEEMVYQANNNIVS